MTGWGNRILKHQLEVDRSLDEVQKDVSLGYCLKLLDLGLGHRTHESLS